MSARPPPCGEGGHRRAPEVSGELVDHPCLVAATGHEPTGGGRFRALAADGRGRAHLRAHAEGVRGEATVGQVVAMLAVAREASEERERVETEARGEVRGDTGHEELSVHAVALMGIAESESGARHFHELERLPHDLRRLVACGFDLLLGSVRSLGELMNRVHADVFHSQFSSIGWCATVKEIERIEVCRLAESIRILS